MDGRYEIGELVATGGMADVYVGRDRVLDREVAVKRLRGGMADQTARDRFIREARVLAAFSHPNSVRVYDALEDDDGPMIVMELVEGETLRALLRREHVLTVTEAVAIADQVLAALEAAHASGIVHRDVKPGNVLITSDGDVKLADFGIATMTDATELTIPGQVLGTPRYLSPEQALGETATPASDLYAVGVLLYEMLTGVAPFDRETAAATLAAQARAPVPPMQSAHADVPDWCAAVVERALAKDPADRFPDATAMRAALHARGSDPAASTAPTVSTEATESTVAMGATATLTATMPAPLALERAPARPPSRAPRPGWLVPAVIGVTALLVGLGAWAFATRGISSPPAGTAVPTTAVPTVVAPVTTVPATTPAPTRVAPTTPTTRLPVVGPAARDAAKKANDAAKKAAEQAKKAAERAKKAAEEGNGPG